MISPTHQATILHFFPGLRVKTRCPVDLPLPRLRPWHPADVDNASVGTKETGVDPDMARMNIPQHTSARRPALKP